MSYEFGTTTVQQDYSRPAPPRRPRWVGILATLVLMGVFVGGLWFAYSRGVRNGTAIADGGAPLFRADTGSVKVKPDQPGGMPVPNQDKLVYNPGRLDTGVERLLPPPEQPLPRPVAPPPSAVQAAAPPSPAVTAQQPAAAQSVAPAAASADAPTIAAPPAAAAPSVAEPRKQPQVASLPPGSSALTPPAAPQSILGVLQSVTGTRVQLGAVKTEEDAKLEWERLKRANPGLLGKAGVQISRADLGDKGVYYRIQTTPVGDAAKLCDSLKSRKVACAVVH